MNLAARSTFSSRMAGIAGAVAVHAALGVALLTTALLPGPGGQPPDANAGRSALVVELLPVPAGGSIAEAGAGKARDMSEAPDEARPSGERAGPITDGRSVGSGLPPQGVASGRDGPALVSTDEAAAGAPTLSGADLQLFRARLLRHIERFRRYPIAAQHASIEGVTHVHFVMDHYGQVSEIWVELSSGSALLDDEAIAAILRARPLPQPPAGWPPAIGVSLPIGYSLQ